MIIQRIYYIGRVWFNRFFDWLTPAGDLLLRLWVAHVFYMEGLDKIHHWDTTIALFRYEYSVPILSADFAAVLSVIIEMTMPLLLLLGLGGRLPALVLFLFNMVAMASYPFLLTENGAVGVKDHFYLGLLLMVLVLHGAGKWSIDTLLKTWLSHEPR